MYEKSVLAAISGHVPRGVWRKPRSVPARSAARGVRPAAPLRHAITMFSYRDRDDVESHDVKSKCSMHEVIWCIRRWAGARDLPAPKCQRLSKPRGALRLRALAAGYHNEMMKAAKQILT
ncbi:hypothetical protein EVAR_12088_1 [Eumeta japonica]|uniref:Uncharacterized protein n=1 Tax=Eumeta variegata TaxID=151549 RepID=A0A4C1U5T7_EUMVA|nr:hypothetical protein EVAR_12088_1 [Eumeta japonica]